MNQPSRPVPDQLAFADGAEADRVVAAIAAEAEQRGIDPADLSHFLQLGEVGLAIQKIQGGERGREMVQGLGALLFHLFHFRRHGDQLIEIGREEVDRLTGVTWPEELRGWSGDIPSDAGYIRLPKNLFWSSPSGDAGADGEQPPAEAIDGIFWTSSVGETLSTAVVSGIVAGRPGFTLIELPPVPRADAPRWPRLRVREDGEDFATSLPGGELGGLHSILEVGEVLKLVSRVFAMRTTSATDDDIAEGNQPS